MRSILEELYYGNISPSDRNIVKGGAYSHILQLLTRNEDVLMQALTQAQQETFEKFKDCASELNDQNELMRSGIAAGMLRCRFRYTGVLGYAEAISRKSSLT